MNDICPNKLAQFMEMQKHPERYPYGAMHWCEWCEARKHEREESEALFESLRNTTRKVIQTRFPCAQVDFVDIEEPK